MTKPHGPDAAGQPLDLIGQPLRPGLGSVPGVVIVETATMPKAETDGTYTLNGNRFRTRKGAPLPEGAVMDSAEVADEPTAKVTGAPAKRSKGAAPENRAKADEPETR